MINKGRRFGLYVLGFGVGCTLAYFTLFRGKNSGYWLPENRVKEKISKSKIRFTDQVKCTIECGLVSEENIKEVLKNGEVNFNESQTHNSPCPNYILENTTTKVSCNSCDSTTEIISVANLTQGVKPCECNN